MVASPTFSVEFFPPRDSAGETRLWQALESLAVASPDFVSVTYGAGGSQRDRTIRVTGEITARTGIPTVAHLTCVGSTAVELKEILDSYKDYGISSILALRGDPEGGPRSPWKSTPGGFDHADELVSLAISMGFKVGVAAFPDGHPASSSFQDDLKVLLEKERRGATFATTQFFFDINRYQTLRDSLAAAGSKMDLIPGILPITNFKQLERMTELSGTPLPAQMVNRLAENSEKPDLIREIGIEIAIDLSRKLIEIEAPGLHFYTMNSADSTLKIVREIGLR
jgi:methylenetetrahydrofolate reductase (NADPH)